MVLFTTEYFLSVESFYTDFSFLFFLQTVQENWTLAFTEELSKVLKVFSIDKKTNYCMNQRQNNCYFMWPSSTDIVSNAHLLFLFFFVGRFVRMNISSGPQCAIAWLMIKLVCLVSDASTKNRCGPTKTAEERNCIDNELKSITIDFTLENILTKDVLISLLQKRVQPWVKQCSRKLSSVCWERWRMQAAVGGKREVDIKIILSEYLKGHKQSFWKNSFNLDRAERQMEMDIWVI